MTGLHSTLRRIHGDLTDLGVPFALVGGLERELVDAAVSMRVLEDVTLPVARLGHLIALKVLSRDDLDRPQDLVDLRTLIRGASPNELVVAAEALELIAGRGYHRGKSLLADLRALL